MGPNERALHDIFTQLRLRTGHDFSNYKRATVLRRIERRISVQQLLDVAAYAQFLREHPEECEALLKDLLISVTNFFRDHDGLRRRSSGVIPRLFQHKGEDDQVRVWVPGCATGEEAYSIGMLLTEHASATPSGAGGPGLRHRHRRAGDRHGARRALHANGHRRRVAGAAAPLLHARSADGYRVRQELREMVLFAHAQPDQGPAVLASRSGVLPQSADLSEPRRAAARDGDLALRAAAGRLPVPRRLRVGRRRGRPVRAGRQGRRPLPEPRMVAAIGRSRRCSDRRSCRAAAAAAATAARSRALRERGPVIPPTCTSGCSSSMRRRR